jgi:glycerol kinase
MPLVLAIDQGTTSSRAVVYDDQLRPLTQAQVEVAPTYPRPGWVEHDPTALRESVESVVAQAMEHGKFAYSDLAAVGITNQRETAIIWERATGRPIGPAIVWQDRRTAEFCERHQMHRPMLAERTGLVLDPYFSATKIAWLLDHVPGARNQAEAGLLAAGTVDTWLVWHLTRGACHVTDRTNASRTLLMDLRLGRWDDDLCAFFAVPRAILPEIRPSRSEFGRLERSGASVPIHAILGDQQASLFGQGGFGPGRVKCTYGTGAFLLAHTGADPVASTSGLVSTAAESLDDRPGFALEGSVFVAGAAVQWFRDGLKAIGAAPEIDPLYDQGRHDSGVVFVPALTGLGAPYWAPEARGTIFGLTRDTSVADLARATIEGVAFQVADLVQAIRNDLAQPPEYLRVDGGMARSVPFLQFQADLLGIPLVRSAQAESTALGAALLAGLGAGLWNSDEIDKLLAGGTTTFEPRRIASWRVENLARWRHAVDTLVRHYGSAPA